MKLGMEASCSLARPAKSATRSPPCRGGVRVARGFDAFAAHGSIWERKSRRTGSLAPSALLCELNKCFRGVVALELAGVADLVEEKDAVVEAKLLATLLMDSCTSYRGIPFTAGTPASGNGK